MRMNEKMREAIRNGKEVPHLIDDDEARREAALLDAKGSELRGKEWGMVRKHWTDQARFRYNGKRNAKRKGTIRNNVEHATIAKIR